MDLLSSQLAELQQTVQSLSSLPSIVARQAAQLEAHSSTIARLSSRNDFLTRTIEDQDKVVAELSRAAIPEGHWVWETEKDKLETSRGRDGRWLFSLEKFNPNPPRIAAGPPTSLLSLPIELTDAIFSLLPRADVLAVCLVSFGLLQRASTIIYPKLLEVDYASNEMYLFVSSRVVGMGTSSNRISDVLLPPVLFLLHRSPPKQKNVAVASLLEGVEGRGQISINKVILAPDLMDPSSSFRQMLPILAFLDPKVLQFGSPNRRDEEARSRIPSILPVTEDELAFLRHWTQLKEFIGGGPSSIPIFSQNGGTLAVSECLLEGTTDAKVVARLMGSTPDLKWLKTLSSTDLVSSLDRTRLLSDRLIVDIYLIVNVCDVESETS